MQDLVGFYVFLDAKSDALDVWGQGSESLKPAIADTEKPEPQMRGGGGALQRAFISEYGSEFKTPEGKISFSEANAAYAIEVAKPASEKLDHIRTKGKRATLACRENFQKFGKRKQRFPSNREKRVGGRSGRPLLRQPLTEAQSHKDDRK